jgi:hypothetical protein
MFTGRQHLRAFFSIAFVALLLAPTVAAQGKPAASPSPSDAVAVFNTNCKEV